MISFVYAKLYISVFFLEAYAATVPVLEAIGISKEESFDAVPIFAHFSNAIFISDVVSSEKILFLSNLFL